MRLKNVAAVAAALLIASPVVAQTSAQALSPVAPARAGAELASESDLAGGGMWAAILGIALLAALVLVVVDDNNVDLPTSP
jgi:hypothetical protein